MFAAAHLSEISMSAIEDVAREHLDRIIARSGTG